MENKKRYKLIRIELVYDEYRTNVSELLNAM